MFEDTQPHTDKKLLYKAFKQLSGALLLMFLSPFIITLGFKEEIALVWAVGLLLGILSIILGFAGFRTLLQALFHKPTQKES